MRELRFEISTLCMYECKICPHKRMIREKKIMDTKVFISILDRLLKEIEPEYINFSGMGEPLLDDDLEMKIGYARGKGLKPSIVTNGFMLNPERFKRLQDSGCETIRISFLGDTPLIYKEKHGRDAFGIVYKNYLDILTLRTTCKVHIYAVGDNAEVYKELFSKADVLEVWRPHNWATAFMIRPIQNNQKLTCNRILSNVLQILVDGRLTICCFDYEAELVYGNTITDTLKEIYAGEVFQKILLAHETGYYAGMICARCDQRNGQNNSLVYSSVNSPDRLTRTSTSFMKI